jgi:WD40 repeat protein
VSRFAIPGQLVEPILALSSDLKLAAASYQSAEGKRVLAVWDAATGQLLRRFEGPSSAIAFSNNGSLLARGDDDGRVTVWSLAHGEMVASLRSGRNAIRCLGFARDLCRDIEPVRDVPGRGWLLAAGEGGGRLTVWDVASKMPRVYCRGGHYDVTAVAFSPDGQTVASGGRGLHFWDLATGQSILQVRDRAPDFQTVDFVQGLSFSPDGSQLAVAGLGIFGDPGIDVWIIEPHRGIQALRGLESQVSRLALSRDGRLIAALALNWQVGIWDRHTGALRHVLEAPKGLTADNAALEFSPDGRRLAFCTWDRAILWDVDAGRALNSWNLPLGVIDTLVFHPSGKLLLGRLETKDRLLSPTSVAHPREHPRVYRVRDLLADPPKRELCELRDISWHAFKSGASPDGRYFVVDGRGGPDGKRRIVRVFDPLTGSTLFETNPDVRFNWKCIELDPTGRVLRIEDEYGRCIGLLEMPSGRWLGTMGARRALALAPDARLLAAVRDMEPGEARHGVSLHDKAGRHLVDLGIDSEVRVSIFDSERRTFAWGSADGTVFVADLNEVQRRLAAVGMGW